MKCRIRSARAFATSLITCLSCICILTSLVLFSHHVYGDHGCTECPCYPSCPCPPVPALMKEHHEEGAYAALTHEIHDLPIHSMRCISAGWDNFVVDVNGEWIFRFPRREELILLLQREQWLLACIHNHISMPIPHYEYVGVYTAFVGYRKILGEPLNKKLYLNLTDKARQKLAESLALFCSQLHTSVDVEEARKHGYKEYHIPLEWIEDSLLDTLTSSEIKHMIEEALEYTKNHPGLPKHAALLHNDLHGENIAFDVGTQRLTGVFDFSDAVIGDYSIEFGQLFTIHQDLAIRTSEAYATLRGVPNPLIPAAVDFILRRAFCILYNREQGNTQREHELIQLLQRFVPIWNHLQY